MLDTAAERLGHELLPVADAEHGDIELEQVRVDRRRSRLVHGRGAAGEDQPCRAPGFDLGRREVERDDLGEDVTLTDSPGDQLCVLGSVVEDQDRPGLAHDRYCAPRCCARCNALPSDLIAGATMTSAFWNSLTEP